MTHARMHAVSAKKIPCQNNPNGTKFKHDWDQTELCWYIGVVYMPTNIAAYCNLCKNESLQIKTTATRSQTADVIETNFYLISSTLLIIYQN